MIQLTRYLQSDGVVGSLLHCRADGFHDVSNFSPETAVLLLLDVDLSIQPVRKRVQSTQRSSENGRVPGLRN